MAFCYWKITKKMGFNPAWGLFAPIPLCGFVWMIYVAFSRWPIETRSVPPPLT